MQTFLWHMQGKGTTWSMWLFLGNDAEITFHKACLNCHLRRTASGTATDGVTSTCNNAAISSGAAVSNGTLLAAVAPVKPNSLKCSLH